MISTTYDYSVPNIIGVTDKNGNTTDYQFTDECDLFLIKDALNRLVRQTYDAVGNVVGINPTDSASTQLIYGTQDQVLNQIDTLNLTISFNYTNDLETPAVVTDTRNNQLAYTYDALGNITSIGYKDGSSEQFVYDETGLLIQQVERNGNTFNYTYDQQGRLIQKTYDDAAFETFTYDNRNNLTSVQDINGGITTFIYDENNQITQISYQNSELQN